MTTMILTVEDVLTCFKTWMKANLLAPFRSKGINAILYSDIQKFYIPGNYFHVNSNGYLMFGVLVSLILLSWKPLLTAFSLFSYQPLKFLAFQLACYSPSLAVSLTTVSYHAGVRPLGAAGV